jgi:hypothetical protein
MELACGFRAAGGSRPGLAPGCHASKRCQKTLRGWWPCGTGQQMEAPTRWFGGLCEDKIEQRRRRMPLKPDRLT